MSNSGRRSSSRRTLNPRDDLAEPNIWTLVKKGNLEKLRHVLLNDSLALKSRHGSNKMPLLHFSIKRLQIEIIEFLLVECRVDVDEVDRKKRTGLHWACLMLVEHMPVFKLVYQSSKNAKMMPDISLKLPIHYACIMATLSIVELLIETGNKDEQLSSTDKLGNTPLHYACETSSFSLVRYLIDNGADPALANSSGETPLHYSIRKGDETVCHILVNSGADISIRYERSLYNERHLKVIRNLLKQAAKDYENDENAENTENVSDPSSNEQDLIAFNYKLNQFGFIVGSEFDRDRGVHDEVPFTEKYKRKVHKWVKIVEIMHSNPAKFLKNRNKIESLIYKGIPNTVRPETWRYISDSIFIRERNQGEYQRLLKIKANKINSIQIDLDIKRTYRSHFLFHERFGQGQISLFNILSAYSVYDYEVGYCQGMSDITAVLLMYFEEEEAFWLLVRFMRDKKFSLTQRFRLDLYGTKRSFYIHDKLMQKYCPRLYALLEENEIHGDHYTIRWYLKLFLDATPFPVSLRIWDVLFYEGADILYTFGIILMGYYQSILMSNLPDQLLMVLTSIKGPPKNITIEKWFKDVRENRIKSKLIRALEEEFDGEFLKIQNQTKVSNKFKDMKYKI